MEVVYNNFAGTGPNLNNPPELRFAKVFTKYTDANGDPLEVHLVMTNMSEYDGRYSKENGKSGKFGNLAFSSGSTRIKIDIVADINNTPLSDKGINITHPFLSFFDFDHPDERYFRYTPQVGECGEVMQFPADQIFRMYSQTTNVLNVYSGDDGMVTASSVIVGDQRDNVKDPLLVTEVQFNRSVGVAFTSTSMEMIVAIADRDKARQGEINSRKCPKGVGQRMLQIAGFSTAKCGTAGLSALPVKELSTSTCSVNCVDVQPPRHWKNPTCLRQLTDTDNCGRRRAGNMTDGYCALTCGVCTPCVMADAVPASEPVLQANSAL